MVQRSLLPPLRQRLALARSCFFFFSFFTSTWKVTLQETLYYNRNVIFECFKQDVYFLKKYGNPGFLLYLEKSGHSHEIL